MRPWDAISAWRMRRFTRPLRDQTRRNEQRLKDGPVEWQDWWSRHGERELRCILMSAWDPLGTSDVPEAWDEYDSYITGVAHRLRDARTEEDAERSVTAYLDHVEDEYMGVAPNPARDKRLLVPALVAWHEWSFRRGGRPPREWIDDD
jgi:hypothetical protein